jgi:dienelactone hydrolase
MPASNLFGRQDDSAGCLRGAHPLLRSAGMAWLMIAGCHGLTACAPAPLMAYSPDTPPLVLVPASQAGVQDKRGRFREIFCSILNTRGSEIPDSRPCEEALTRVGSEPAGTGKPVELGQSKRRLIGAVVAGVGYECFEQWLQAPGSVGIHLRQFGYDLVQMKVDALSSSAKNARQIRDAIMAMPAEAGPPRLVLIGYSKGAPDILEAMVNYPEIRGRVAAVVSAAGSVGGSALANDAEQYQADLLRHFPGATCDSGDGGAIDSLRPATRKNWLAQHRLPSELNYYSLVTFPQPDHISAILKSSYNKLASIDARNDSQVIFYDQIVPGSRLMGYINADHWALAVPIARTHSTLGSLLVTQNAYPREALAEAMLRFVEEDLAASEHLNIK